MARTPTRKVIVCITPDLLRATDTRARKLGENRSSVVRDALRKLLAEPQPLQGREG